MSYFCFIASPFMGITDEMDQQNQITRSHIIGQTGIRGCTTVPSALFGRWVKSRLSGHPSHRRVRKDRHSTGSRLRPLSDQGRHLHLRNWRHLPLAALNLDQNPMRFQTSSRARATISFTHRYQINIQAC
jgi:hypothetical protein